MLKIGIVDLGISNVSSVQNMIKHVSHLDSVILNSPENIDGIFKLILPGVGHFQHAMEILLAGNWIPFLERHVQKGNHILGICLGAQLLTTFSEEGKVSGIGLIEGAVKKFEFKTHNVYKVPHMGWNFVEKVQVSKLSENLDLNSRFYFVHSYHFVDIPKEQILFETEYGYKFCSGFQKDNIVGVQFHPEKSHKYGMQFLKSFIDWN